MDVDYIGRMLTNKRLYLFLLVSHLAAMAGTESFRSYGNRKMRWSKKWTSVALLCFVNLINYMDRFTVSGVLSEIEADMGLEHWQAGLLQTAFIICYFASAPVFGYLGDRYSRKWLMIVGMLAWSACTLIGTFMATYWPFLAFRAAIGFGEAGFTSIAPTVLGDLYADEGRSIVLACFYFAIPVGSGLGYIVGSGVGSLFGDWRWGLRVTPLLNVVAVILMVFFMEDPERGEVDTLQHPTQSAGGGFAEYVEDLRYLIFNRSFVLTTLGFTFLCFCTGSLSWWGPIYVEDAIKVRLEHGLGSEVGVDEVAFIFGAIMCISGVLGLCLGSGLSYKFRYRVPWIDPAICGLGLIVSAPFLFCAIGFAKDDVVGALMLVALGEVFLNMNWAVVVDISLYVVVPNRRSSAEAIQLMLSHALGEAGSPYIIGLMAGYLKDDMIGNPSHNPNNSTMPMSEIERDYFAFQYSLFLCLAFEAVGGLFFLWTIFYVVEDRRKAAEYTINDFASTSTIASHSEAQSYNPQPGTSASSRRNSMSGKDVKQS
eukprot:maker-scaffold64_size435223-snap-gene-0.6 protein:Tk02484 transcript:maker-scaffold64_size435223-snap-gene-0.6-mRNA-1 annotation:"GI19157"